MEMGIVTKSPETPEMLRCEGANSMAGLAPRPPRLVEGAGVRPQGLAGLVGELGRLGGGGRGRGALHGEEAGLRARGRQDGPRCWDVGPHERREVGAGGRGAVGLSLAEVVGGLHVEAVVGASSRPREGAARHDGRGGS
jgi:hypothetical protein